MDVYGNRTQKLSDSHHVNNLKHDFATITGVYNNAVAKWLTAGQGFQITKWPAVWYFSQGIEGAHLIQTA